MMRLEDGSTSYESEIKVRLLTDLSEEERQRTSTDIGFPSVFISKIHQGFVGQGICSSFN